MKADAMKDKNEIDVGKFVKIFNNMLDSKVNRDFRKWDLTCSQHAIIAYLYDNQSVETTQRDLEETLEMRRVFLLTSARSPLTMLPTEQRVKIPSE